MKWSFFAILLIVLSACIMLNPEQKSDILNGGTTIDNHGDGILCEDNGHESPFVGEYSFDYLMTYDPATVSDQKVFETWDEYRANLTDTVGRLMPQQKDNFVTFLNHLESTSPDGPYEWQAGLPVNSLEAIESDRTLPRNCYRVFEEDRKELNAIQVIRRKAVQSAANKVFFQYDRDRFQRWKRDIPQQFSYLIVHEWLWNFSITPWLNYTINSELHSHRTDEWSRSLFTRRLNEMGMGYDVAGNLVELNERDQRPFDVFENARECDFNVRVSKRFIGNRVYVELAPGQSEELSLRFTEEDDILRSKACGFSVHWNHEFDRSSGSRYHVTVKTTRPKAKLEVPMQDGGKAPQFYHGLCTGGRSCTLREGDLKSLLVHHSNLRFKWKMIVKNTSSQRIRIYRPHMVFYKRRR